MSCSKNKNYTYNFKNLSTKYNNTLIIIDWDDTLYPTSWLMSNNIDLTNPRLRTKYMTYFENLDNILSATLEHIKTLGDLIIITNAMPEWIELSVSVLPKTQKCLKDIEIISARKRYHQTTKISEWKKNTFYDEIVKRSKYKKYYNIMSLGDAEFEYNALINLYDLNNIPHKYLKSIKFIKTTEYKIIIDQLIMIHDNIKKLCIEPRHIDLTFDYV